MITSSVHHTRLFSAAAIAVLVALAPGSSRAQSAQVTLLNIPAVLDAPFVSELRQRVDLGYYGMQFTYLNPLDPAPVDIRFRLAIYHENDRILDATSLPTTYAPGTYVYSTFDEDPSIDFGLTFEDLLDLMSSRFQEILIRTGMLPEGRYRIEMEPVVDGAALVTTIPALAEFEVRYPAPPIPLFPAEGEAVAAQPITFSWTPVLGFPGDLYEYELLLVEVAPTQTPLQAIQSNRPHTDEPVVTTSTTFTLTADYPPLEAGATYAYQITAEELNRGLPLADEGRSEIVTFTFGSFDGLIVLVQPTDGAVVDDAPTFTWTTTATALHELSVYPIPDLTRPDEAVATEEPVVQADVTGFTGYAYDGPPLDPGADYAWLIRLLHPATGEVIGESAVATFQADDDATIPPPIAQTGAMLDVRWPVLGELSASYPPPIRVHFPDLAEEVTLILTSPTLGVTELNADDFDDADEAIIDPTVWAGAESLPPPVAGTLYEWNDFSARVVVDGAFTSDPAPFGIAFVYTEPHVTAISPVNAEPVTSYPPPIELHVDGATPGMTLIVTSPELGVREITDFDDAGNAMLDPAGWGAFDGPPPVPDSVYTWDLGARIVSYDGVRDPESVPISFTYTGPLVLGRPRPVGPGWPLTPLPDAVADVSTFTWDGVAIPAHESPSLADDVVYRIFLIELDGATWQAPYDAPPLAQAQLASEAGRTRWSHSFDEVDWQAGQAYGWYVQARDLGPNRLPIMHDGFSEVLAFVFAPDSSGLPLAQFEVVSPVGGEAVFEYPPPIHLRYPGLPDDATVLITSPTLGVHEIAASAFDASDEHVIPGSTWLYGLEEPPVVGRRYDWNDFVLRVITDSMLTAPTPFEVSFTYQGALTLGRPLLGEPGDNAMDFATIATPPEFAWTGVQVPDGSPQTLADNVAYRLYVTAWDAPLPPQPRDTTARALPPVAQVQLPTEAGRIDWSHTFADEEVTWQPGQAYAWYVRAVDLAASPAAIMHAGYSPTYAFVYDPDGTYASGDDGLASGYAVIEDIAWVRDDGALTVDSLDDGSIALDGPGTLVLDFTPTDGPSVGPLVTLPVATAGLTFPAATNGHPPLPSAGRLDGTGEGFAWPFGAFALSGLAWDPLGGLQLSGRHGLPIAGLADTGAGDASGLPQDTLTQQGPANPISLPPCLADQLFDVTMGDFAAGAFEAVLPATVIEEPGCEIAFGDAGSLWVTDLGGVIEGDLMAADGDAFAARTTLGGYFTLGGAFQCPQGADLDLGATALTLHHTGLVEGTIAGLAPQCAFPIGPFTAEMRQSDLRFGADGDRQTARLELEAAIQFADTLSVAGEAAFDLMTGSLDTYRFVLEDPFTFYIPDEAQPALAFRINQAELSEAGLLIDGQHALDLGVETAAVTFDDLLLDVTTMQVASGAATFDEAIGFKLTIDEATFGLTFAAVPGDADLGTAAGALVRLAAGARLDANGLAIQGEAEAQLNYGTWSLDSLTVAFSDDFTFGLVPFQIATGRMDFYLGDQRIAFADAFGFHPDINFFLLAALPAQLPLPHLDVAYLVLKDAAGNLLVDIETGEGTTTLSTRDGQPIDFVVPLFQGDALTPPTVPVSFSGLTLDASLNVTEGGLAVSVGGDPQFDLPGLGIPLDLTGLAYELRGGVRALHLDGLLHLLDHPTDCPTSFAVQSNAIIEGSVTCPGLTAEIPLATGTSLLLDVQAVHGSVALAPLQPALTTFSLALDANVELRSATDLLAGASVVATLDESGFRIDQYQPTGGSPQLVDLGPAALRFDGMTSFFLEYDFDAGWDFLIGLDMAMRVGFEAGQSVMLPLRGTEISPDGVSIPAQIMNDATDPAVPAAPLHAGPAVLTLLEVVTDPILLTLDGLTLAEPFIPTFDLAVSLPGLAGVSPELAAASFTIEDATVEEGFVEGTLVPYVFAGDGAYVGFGDAAGLYLTSVEGSLDQGTRLDGTPVQDYTLALTATPHLGGTLDGGDGTMTWTTDQATAALVLSREALRGTITTIGGSGQLTGNTALSVANGTIEIEQIYAEVPVAGGRVDLDVADQTLEVSGEVVLAVALGAATVDASVLTVSVLPENVVRATGKATVDLLAGTLSAESALTAEGLQLAYPVGQAEPLFGFAIDTVTLTGAAIVLDGNGSLDAAGTAAAVDFDGFTLGYDGTLVSGTVSIQESIGFQFDFPADWSLMAPLQPPALTDGVWFTFPSATLGVNGITLNGTSGAGLYLGGTPYEDLEVAYAGLTLTFSASGPPVVVAGGRADFNLAQGDGSTERLAYLDADGFHLDNLLAAIDLPDRIGLPTVDVAYLEVRDPLTGTDLVETAAVAGGTEVRTVGNQTVRLVLPGFDDGGAPLAFDVAFNLTIDDAFAVTAGVLDVDLSTQPLSMEGYGFPLDLLGLRFDADAGNPAMTASAQLRLPASLGDLDVDLIELTFGPDGFAYGKVNTGTYTTSCPASPPPAIATADLGDGALTIDVGGVELVFGVREAFKFSGTLTSDLFAPADAPETAYVCYAAAFTPQGWAFVADASNLMNGEIPLGVARLDLNPVDGLLVEATETDFDVLLNGTLYADELLGSSFALAIEPLRVGTSGVVLDASTVSGQTIPLFDGIAEIELTQAEVTYVDRELTFDLDGTLSVFDRNDIAFTGLRFGTGGALSVNDVDLLPGSQEIAIIPEIFAFDDLRFAVEDGTLTLTAGGAATLPAPLDVDADVNVNLGTDGSFDIDGPAFVFDTGYEIGNNPETELGLGDLATLDLTGVGIDLGFGPAGLNGRRPLEAALLATFAIYFENDTENRITFGTATDLLNRPGFIAGTDGTMQWSNVLLTGEVGYDTDFFHIMVTSAKSLEGRFGLELDANAGLKLEGVSGTGALDDMIISELGLEDPGDFGGATFALENVFSLEVGTFQEGSGPIQITEGNGDPNDPATETETIQTEKYLLFTSGGNGGDVLRLTLDKLGASGGVGDVIYYKKAGGDGVYLSIRDAGFSLAPGGSGSDVSMGFTATFTYETDGAGGFALRVGGAASIGAVGGALTGTIATLNDEFSAGLFVAFNAPIPILPGIVELTGAGGGFFVNPAQEDRDIVLSTLSTLDTNLGDFADAHANAPFDADAFMVMLYAKIGLIGAGGSAYLINGSGYLELTDASFTIYGYGGLLGQLSDPLVETEFDLSVGWGGGVTSIEGTSRVAANFDVLATAEASANFAYYKEPAEEAIWAITLSADADMLGVLTLDSDVILAPGGFYADIEVTQGFDIAIVSFESRMAGSFWVYTDGDFGAWGEATIEASVLLGAAKIGGGLEAALIKSGSTDFLYGALTGYVSIIGFKGDVTFWIAVEDGDIDFGEGENPEFDALIAEAREEAEGMAEEAEAIVAAIEEMELVTFTDEQLATAGAYIMTADWGAQFGFSLTAVGNEFQIAGSQQPIQVLYDQANAIQATPGLSDHQDALDDFLTGLEAIEADADAVIDRLNTIEATAIAFTAASSDLFDDFPAGTPVQRAQLSWDGCRPVRPACAPGFAIDEAKAQAQSDVLGELQAEIQALDAAYAEAIATVEDNINEIDDLMAAQASLGGIDREYGGILTARRILLQNPGAPSVNGIAEDYTEVLEDASAYFARHLGYLWSLEDWAEAHQVIFDDREDAIRSTLEDLRAIYEANEDYELAKEVIEERWRIVKKLELLAAGEDLDDAIAGAIDQAEQWSEDADLAGIVDELQRLHALPSTLGSAAEAQIASLRNDLYAVFEESGMDLWYGVPSSGVALLLDEVPGQVDAVVAARPGTLGALMTAHRNLTAGIDAIYASKTELLADLYGLYEIYATWRAGTLGAGTDDVLRDQQAIVAQQLEAPVIQDITVSPVQEGYHTRADVSWTATHPAETIEHALMITDEFGVDLSTTASPISVGGRTSFRQYAAREGDELIMQIPGQPGMIRKHFTATVRARGEGGVTASRVASYHLVINADGSTTGSGGSTGPILTEDTTPPSRPTITLPYPLGQNGLSHWSPSLTELDVELTATDAESDVVRFEVALSTTLAGTNVLDWTTVYGTWADAGNNDVSGTRTLEATLRGLSLEAGGTYFVHARAVNGEGLVSPIRYKVIPVTIDPTPPTWDVAAAGPQWRDVSARIGGQFSHGSTAVAPLAPTPGVVPYVQMTDPPQREDTTEEPASVEVTWSVPAIDAESGMMHYEYVVLSSSGAATPFSGRYPVYTSDGEDVPFTIQNDEVNYDDAFYVYVRAVNHAGTPGADVLEIGPIELTDPSKPTTPGLTAQASAHGIYLFVKKLADDQETDVVGYRYAIGTTPGGTDVVPARDMGVDIEQPDVIDPAFTPVLLVRTVQGSSGFPDQDTGPIGPGLPDTGLPGTNGLDLPDVPGVRFLPTGQDLYVQIKAVNADGLTSLHSQYVGPLRLDLTPPDPFTVTVTYNTDECIGVNVRASGVRDGETGLLSVEYTIKDASGGATIKGWAELPGGSLYGTTRLSGSRLSGSIPLQTTTYEDCWPASPNADRIEVTVRATNNLGLVTESTTVFSPYLTTYTSPVLMGGP